MESLVYILGFCVLMLAFYQLVTATKFDPVQTLVRALRCTSALLKKEIDRMKKRTP